RVESCLGGDSSSELPAAAIGDETNTGKTDQHHRPAGQLRHRSDGDHIGTTHARIVEETGQFYNSVIRMVVTTIVVTLQETLAIGDVAVITRRVISCRQICEFPCKFPRRSAGRRDLKRRLLPVSGK